MSDSVAQQGLLGSDLRPTAPSDRSWEWRDFASIWLGTVACVPSYLLACGMLDHGMAWWQAVSVVFLGNLVVVLPMVLVGSVGARLGLAHPIMLQLSFGPLGARLPVALRMVLGLGWFSLQTWVGAQVIYVLLNELTFGMLKQDPLPLLGINIWQLLCFVGFGLAQIELVRRAGMEGLRRFARLAAPVLAGAGALFVLWAWVQADGFTSMLSTTSRFAEGQPMSGQEMAVFPQYLGEMAALWLFMAVNISDYTRFSATGRQQALGQLLGLPIGLTLFSLVGVTVSFATVDIFNAELRDPLAVVQRMGGFFQFLGLLLLGLAALTTNIFAHLLPASIGLVSFSSYRLDLGSASKWLGLTGLLLMPFMLLESTGGGVFTWLTGLGALLSPVVGILLVDGLLFRVGPIDVAALVEPQGPYSGTGGLGFCALLATLIGVAPVVPGLLMGLGILGSDVVPQRLEMLYPFSPILSLLLAAAIYFVLRKGVDLIMNRSENPSTDHPTAGEQSAVDSGFGAQ
ncbi:MAG: nitrate reductase [Rickettsiales bacterium]|nr:nitrate reductase [Rickettsiales bacterium]